MAHINFDELKYDMMEEPLTTNYSCYSNDVSHSSNDVQNRGSQNVDYRYGFDSKSNDMVHEQGQNIGGGMAAQGLGNGITIFRPIINTSISSSIREKVIDLLCRWAIGEITRKSPPKKICLNTDQFTHHIHQCQSQNIGPHSIFLLSSDASSQYDSVSYKWKKILSKWTPNHRNKGNGGSSSHDSSRYEKSNRKTEKRPDLQIKTELDLDDGLFDSIFAIYDLDIPVKTFKLWKDVLRHQRSGSIRCATQLVVLVNSKNKTKTIELGLEMGFQLQKSNDMDDLYLNFQPFKGFIQTRLTSTSYDVKDLYTILSSYSLVCFS